jgi:hypothetical protein
MENQTKNKTSISDMTSSSPNLISLEKKKPLESTNPNRTKIENSMLLQPASKQDHPQKKFVAFVFFLGHLTQVRYTQKP